MKTNDNQPIVDAMLDEWLGNRLPRPLSPIDLSNQSVDSQRAAEFEQAIQAAAMDIGNLSFSSPVSLYRKRTSYSLAFKAFAALAACFVLGAGIWSLVIRDRLLDKYFDRPSLAANKNDSNKQIDNAPAPSIVGPALNKELSLENNSTNAIASKVDRETLPLDTLPFNTRESVASKSKQTRDHTNRDVKLDESQVIAAIDQQMLQLWNNRDAKPAAPIDGVAWIGRVNKKLLSRSATQDEMDAFAKKDSPALRLEALHRIADSSEFSRVWAKRLAFHYLDIDPVANRDLSDERRAFVQWIQSEINQTHRLDSVVKNIVLAKGVGRSSPSHLQAVIGGRRPV